MRRFPALPLLLRGSRAGHVSCGRDVARYGGGEARYPCEWAPLYCNQRHRVPSFSVRMFVYALPIPPRAHYQAQCLLGRSFPVRSTQFAIPHAPSWCPCPTQGPFWLTCARVAGRRTTSDALSVTRQSVAGASERTAVKGSLTSMSKPAVAPMPFVFRHHTDHVLQMEVGTCRGFVSSAAVWMLGAD